MHGYPNQQVTGPRGPAMVPQSIDLLDRAGQPASGVDWLDSPTFALALRAMCETEARRRLLASWLDEAGLLDEDGHPRPAVRSLEAAERSLDRKLNDLGLTPKSAAALASTLRAVIAPPIVTEVHPRLREAAERAQEARQVNNGPEAPN